MPVLTKKKLKAGFREFDVANYLDSPEMIAAYLAVAIEEAEGNMAIITRALNTVARAHNMSQLAREAGVTREGLYKALSPEGNPSFQTVMKLLQSFGLQMSVKPVR